MNLYREKKNLVTGVSFGSLGKKYILLAVFFSLFFKKKMVQSLNVSGVVNAFRVIWNPSLAMPHIIVNGNFFKKVEENEEIRVDTFFFKKIYIHRYSLYKLFQPETNW